MNCTGFEELLEDYMTGDISGSKRHLFEEHADSCSHCYHMLSIALGRIDLLSPETSRQLTLSILDRTSGSTCLQAQSRLCDLVDKVLSPESEQIAWLHINSCQGCGALAETLIELRSALPEMAELEPDELFAAAVLESTSSRKAPFEKIRSRTARWWHNIVRSPRFAWEAAYAGALIFFLAFGNLGSSWRDPPVIIPDSFQQSLVRSRSKAAQITEGISFRLAGRRKQITQSLDNWNKKGLGYLDEAITANTSVLESFRESTTASLHRIWVQLNSRKGPEKPNKDKP